jgi:uncharacterized PurR-regulated membrane protein YhhQ (DUF165 family)
MGLISCFYTAANLSANKAIILYGVHLTAGFFSYPFVYFFAAILIATRDQKTYNFSIFIAYILSFIFLSLMIISSLFPVVESELEVSNAMSLVFGVNNYRVFIASTVSYCFSMFLFGFIYSAFPFFKLYIRIFFATACCAVIDVNLFFLIAYLGVRSNELLFEIMFWASFKKVILQISLIPLSLIIINRIRNLND